MFEAWELFREFLLLPDGDSPIGLLLLVLALFWLWLGLFDVLTGSGLLLLCLGGLLSIFLYIP